MILVTVGTEQYPFNALLDWIGALMHAGFIAPEEDVVVQYGAATRLPDRIKIYQRLPESEFKTLVSQARLVIAHCGEGTALLLKTFDVPYVLVPRTGRLGEHVDDHQLEMAAALEKQGVAIARSPADLVRFLDSPTVAAPHYEFDDRLCAALSQRCPDRATQRMMLVCSAGGHFKAMQSLRGFWETCADRTWVTFQTRATATDLSLQGDRVHWAYHPTNRNLPNLVRNLVLAVGVLRQERPEVIVSTGAGVAVPFLLLAKLLLGSTVIFVESKTRLQKLSLSARILRACGVLDHLIIQSAALSADYPEAIVVDSTAIADPAQPTELTSVRPNVEHNPIWRLHDTVLVLAPDLEGKLDAVTLMERAESAYSFTSEPQFPRTLVVDMQAIQTIDSIGMDALLQVWRKVKAAQGQLVVWSVQPKVQAVLHRARFERLFHFDSATGSLRQPVAIPTKSPVITPQTPWRRAVDIAAAIVGLVSTTVLLLPLAIAIKLESAGPIFTRELRSGYMGQQFSAWKFRTTALPAPATADLDIVPQVTQVGKVLRYLRLNKLPLFWNVLVGDMRLLGGYAPHSPSLDREAPPTMLEPKFLDSKPGILGEWELTPGGEAPEIAVAMVEGVVEQPLGVKVLDEPVAILASPMDAPMVPDRAWDG
jgi:anti-anti-sigma factor